ncbi:GerAB/ArcD/ProY family transporter [Lysinibacillus sp. C5.1]|uniref:GerAB/ArcD/ProY family transporter n=1 Tax=Lysinibacillus sp. C5.1 TaxID=2796169 RepID=UPI0030812130
MEKQLLSARQFTIITLLHSIGTAILIVPASITKQLHQDAWIGATIGVLLSSLIVKLYTSLGTQTPHLTFVEANGKILGKFFGTLTSLGFITLAFFSASELLYFIGIFMQTEVMPETPTLSFAVLFTIILVFASFLGIEVFARSAEILFPIFLFIFIVFLVCISPQINIENIQPIFETKTTSLITGILKFMSIFSFPLVMLLMIFPSAVNIPKAAQKGFYFGTLCGGIVLIIIIALSTLVIGPTNTSIESFPSYALAQRISIGNFFQRVEIVMAVMWIISIYIRTFLYFYASVIGIAQILNIKDPRPLILPLGMCMIALSQIVHPNIVHSNNYNQKIWPLYSGLFTVLLALLLLVIAKMRKIKSKTAGDCSNQQTDQSTLNSSETP